MWQAFVKAGIAVAKAYAGHRVAKAQFALGAAKARYENAIRQGRNELSGAEAALAGVAQGIANRRRLDAAGENLARGGEALARGQEAAAANSFSRRIQAAEGAGAAVASAAFAGITGGSAATLVETAALRQDMVEELAERQQDQQEYELRKNVGEQVGAGIAGLDQRLIRANMDLGVSVNQVADPGSMLGALTHPEIAKDLYAAGTAAFEGFQARPAQAATYAGGTTNDSFFGGNRGSGD